MILTEKIERPKLVLVVDDHEINRDALGMILEEDYKVLFAENGAEGLDEVYRHKIGRAHV